MKIAARILAGTAGSGLAIAYHAGIGRDPACVHEGTKSENDGGSVAAGIGDEARFGDFRCVQLGDAVNGFAKPSRVRSRELVPGGERFSVTETEGTTEIDNAEVRVEQGWSQLGRYLMGRSEERGAGIAGGDGLH